MSPTQIGTVDPRQIWRKLRIMWVVMLFALGMYVVALILIHDSSMMPPDRTVQFGLSICGIVTGAVVLYLRFVRIAGLYSRSEPMDTKTLALRANFNYILCFVFSESTSLFGFALAFLHGAPKFYASLYLGGVLLCYAFPDSRRRSPDEKRPPRAWKCRAEARRYVDRINYAPLRIAQSEALRFHNRDSTAKARPQSFALRNPRGARTLRSWA